MEKVCRVPIKKAGAGFIKEPFHPRSRPSKARRWQTKLSLRLLRRQISRDLWRATKLTKKSQKYRNSNRSQMIMCALLSWDKHRTLKDRNPLWQSKTKRVLSRKLRRLSAQKETKAFLILRNSKLPARISSHKPKSNSMKYSKLNRLKRNKKETQNFSIRIRTTYKLHNQAIHHK